MKAALFAAGAAALLSACASTPRLDAQWPQMRGLELTDTPFFPQEAFQCGPAALATVLGASEVAVAPEQLVPQVFIPGRKGSLQLELVAATRRHDRVPYILKPGIEAIFREIEAGTPVLLLQNLGVSWLPVWHYAVVIGVDPAQDEVILRSGIDERRRMSFRHFRNSWQRGGRWAMVTVPPDRIPVTAEPLDWLDAVLAFEKLGKPDLALAGYRAAAQRWPTSPLVWQLLGNAHYAAADHRAAHAAFLRATELAPSAAAFNNLAQTELDLGCTARALATLELARLLPANEATQQALQHTAAAAQAAKAVAGECPLQ